MNPGRARRLRDEAGARGGRSVWPEARPPGARLAERDPPRETARSPRLEAERSFNGQ